MALERVFECPRTLRRLRSGPLGKLLEGFCNWLLEHGFSRWTIRTHLSNVSHLNEHLGGPSSGVHKSVSTRDVEGFIKAYPLRCRNRGAREEHVRRVGYSVNRFLHYLGDSGLLDSLAPQQIYQPLLDAYLKWMRDYQHAADGTLKVRCHSIAQFLQWLGPEATPEGLLRLTAERIEDFFLSYAQSMGRSARRSMQSALRTFLRFCLHQDYIEQPLERAVPTLRTYKLATVPRGLSDTEAQRVLQCINRNSHVGRRDYAIVQLLYTYGVRGGQVRALRLQDIDWAQNQILFKASKQGKDSRLPLTAEVGESLLDYLQNSRPPYSYPQVFLSCRAPYHPFAHSSSLSAIVERRIRAAGIELPSKGAHAFRHCFATRMLHKGHSLKAVADVLGHRHLGTTFIYTKVDFNALKQVALQWPQEVWQ
ncbi:MAG: tyrosine-type recombinase/integrase [Deltaproteobacteria bacterium]|nr:tyrosine-type recombinase/integrase [Deltaproteobacteria bacterium]